MSTEERISTTKFEVVGDVMIATRNIPEMGGNCSAEIPQNQSQQITELTDKEFQELKDA